MYYYTAIERFDRDNGERWVGYTRWLGRTDLTRIITLDSALCPPVVHPESADDWQFVAKEEFMLDFFTSLDFVLQRVAGHRPSVVIAVARDPSADDVSNFPHPDFELAGFDVVDAQFTASAVLNHSRFSRRGQCFKAFLRIRPHQVTGVGLPDSRHLAPVLPGPRRSQMPCLGHLALYRNHPTVAPDTLNF